MTAELQLASRPHPGSRFGSAWLRLLCLYSAKTGLNRFDTVL